MDVVVGELLEQVADLGDTQTNTELGWIQIEHTREGKCHIRGIKSFNRGDHEYIRGHQPTLFRIIQQKHIIRISRQVTIRQNRQAILISLRILNPATHNKRRCPISVINRVDKTGDDGERCLRGGVKIGEEDEGGVDVFQRAEVLDESGALVRGAYLGALAVSGAEL